MTTHTHKKNTVICPRRPGNYPTGCNRFAHVMKACSDHYNHNYRRCTESVTPNWPITTCNCDRRAGWGRWWWGVEVTRTNNAASASDDGCIRLRSGFNCCRSNARIGCPDTAGPAPMGQRPSEQLIHHDAGDLGDRIIGTSALTDHRLEEAAMRTNNVLKCKRFAHAGRMAVRVLPSQV